MCATNRRFSAGKPRSVDGELHFLRIGSRQLFFRVLDDGRETLQTVRNGYDFPIKGQGITIKLESAF
jgi:hypothetical protein